MTEVITVQFKNSYHNNNDIHLYEVDIMPTYILCKKMSPMASLQCKPLYEQVHFNFIPRQAMLRHSIEPSEHMADERREFFIYPNKWVPHDATGNDKALIHHNSQIPDLLFKTPEVY